MTHAAVEMDVLGQNFSVFFVFYNQCAYMCWNRVCVMHFTIYYFIAIILISKDEFFKTLQILLQTTSTKVAHFLGANVNLNQSKTTPISEAGLVFKEAKMLYIFLRKSYPDSQKRK